MVADINGTTTADVTNLINVNGTLYFAAYTTRTGSRCGRATGRRRDGDGHQPDTGARTSRELRGDGHDALLHGPRGGHVGAADVRRAPTITWASPGGHHLRHGAVRHPARRHRQRARDLRLHARRGHGASARATRPSRSPSPPPTPPTTPRRPTRPRSAWRRPRRRSPGPPRRRSPTARRCRRAQLDATASVPGTFTYTPAAGTVLGAGTPDPLRHLHPHRHHRLRDGDRRPRPINVAQATPTITWATPAAITYGTALSAPPSSTPPPRPRDLHLHARRRHRPGRRAATRPCRSPSPPPTPPTTPAPPARPRSSSTQATPTITWAPRPHHLRHARCRATQLDATASVARDLHLHARRRHRPGRGHRQTLSVTFTPTDTTDYTTATGDDHDRRHQATPTITWAHSRGDHLRHGALARPSSTPPPACPGPSPTRRPPAPSSARAPDPLGHLHAHRHHRLHDRHRHDDDHVAQATPTITWATPAAIAYGTALSAPSSTPPPASRGPSPTRPPPAPSCRRHRPDALRHLHAHRHHRLHQCLGDDDHQCSGRDRLLRQAGHDDARQLDRGLWQPGQRRDQQRVQPAVVRLDHARRHVELHVAEHDRPAGDRRMPSARAASPPAGTRRPASPWTSTSPTASSTCCPSTRWTSTAGPERADPDPRATSGRCWTPRRSRRSAAGCTCSGRSAATSWSR